MSRRSSKAFVKPSDWARAHGKPVSTRPVTREEHRTTHGYGEGELSVQTTALAVNPASTASALLLVLGEIKRTETRQLPADPLRRCALVNEEAGEALRAVLDLTRDPALSKAMRNEVRRELVQCASMAVTVIAAMLREEADAPGAWSTDAAAAVAAHPIEWDSKRKAIRYKKR